MTIELEAMQKLLDNPKEYKVEKIEIDKETGSINVKLALDIKNEDREKIEDVKFIKSPLNDFAKEVKEGKILIKVLES
jgi:hypothetical protein